MNFYCNTIYEKDLNMPHKNKETIEKHLNVKLIPAKEYNPALQGDGWNDKYIICQATEHL